MLHLPSELRIKIYFFVLFYDKPISLTELITLDTSLLRTCVLLRREATLVFYNTNCFILGASDLRATLPVCKTLEMHACLIRSIILDIRCRGLGYTNLIWDLILLSRDQEIIYRRVLREFQFLRILSIQLTASCDCHEHQTQVEATICNGFRESCLELVDSTVEWCRERGTVQASYPDERSITITTSLAALSPDQAN
jgi:hypothetical protein